MESLFFSYRRIAWLKDITESGASFAKSESEKRNIILTNGIAIVSSCAVVALMIFRSMFENMPLQSTRNLLYPGVLLFLLPILLNRKGFTTISRVAMCWIPPIFVMSIAYFVLQKEQATAASYVGMRYYLLGFCCPPFQIFNVPRERVFSLALLVPVLSIVLFDPIVNLLGVGYYDYNSVDYQFNNVRAIISVGVISVASYMLKSRADRNEELNSKLISELALKNEEIQRQASDKVHELNKELYKNLQQLGEREFILNQSQRIAKVGSWEYTIEGTSLFWSDEMYNIFGLDKSFYIQANNLGEVIGGEAGQSVITATGNLLKTGEPFDLTTRIRMPLGYTKWLRLYAYPVRENGTVLGVRGICHDITYYKEAEELLRASDKKYRSLFEQASDAIIVTDFRGNFTDANTSFRKMFGYSLEELLGMNIGDVIDQEEIIRRPIMFDILAEGIHIFNERRMVTKLGVVRDVEANVKKIDDRQVMAIIRDVTELRRVQKQIQISEARFRGAFEYSAIGMSIVSLQGQWLRVNREFLNMVGYSETEIVGRQFREITHPADVKENIILFEEAVNGVRETYRMEKRYIHKNGSMVWVRLNVSMIKDDRARPLYCVAQIEDVTQEREASEKLMVSQANLRATINNTNILIWSVDSDFKLLTFNDPFHNYMKTRYGLNLEVGLRMFSGELNDDKLGVISRWTERYRRALAGETFQFEETRFEQDLQYSISPICEGDSIIGVSVFAENVTRRKEHDRELVEANKKIEELKLMALRSVMSPHFIFNVLNSIQFFIARNDRLNAINYLSTFSKLIRSILNQSISNRIKLAEEVDMLKNYVHLEMTRFEDKFNFVMNVSDDVDMETIEIPSLLVQPYVENAILHGLYNKKSPGTLTIRVTEGVGSVVFEIEDDGVGRAEAMRVRELNFPSHKSMGIRVTEERLKLIKQQNNTAFEIEDLADENGEPSGTKVRISIPY
jgi:PAS domain S-box-containing protein